MRCCVSNMGGAKRNRIHAVVRCRENFHQIQFQIIFHTPRLCELS
jgi:hypothetical protein